MARLHPDPARDAEQPPRESLTASRVRPAAGFVLAACSWTAVLLVINRALFHLRLIETGDLATILYQVKRAQRFHELLGNYSRFQFHHPGPAFMYLLALGDWIFRGLLHLCPEPANAALLTVLLFNVACLFASIRIFARHCRSSLFLPACPSASVALIYLIDRTNYVAAVTDVWLPHMLLFVFLLFLAVCASVGTGEATDLPLLMFCGGFLIHGHVAQILFVGVLAAGAVLGLLVNRVPDSGPRHFLRTNRMWLLSSVAIAVVFVLPMILDRLVDHPNNVHQIAAHLSRTQGDRNSFGDALKYEFSFFLFTPAPETKLPGASVTQLVDAATKQSGVAGYWLGIVVLCATAIVFWRRRKMTASAFWTYNVIQLAVVGVLFLYWARRMTGPFYGFNGFFFYAEQFAGVFVVLAVVLNGLRVAVKETTAVVLACAVPLLIFISPGSFQRVGTSVSASPVPEYEQFAQITDRIAQAVPRTSDTVRLRFSLADNEWVLATGVASRLAWAGQRVCVDEDATRWFENRDVCRSAEGLRNLTLTREKSACVAPCETLLDEDGWRALLEPFSAGKLPFAIGYSGDNSLNLNFYDPDISSYGPVWTKNRSSMRFLLASDWGGSGPVRIRINGIAVRGRIVEVLLNGEEAGTLQGDGALSRKFLLPSRLFRAGQQNEVTFKGRDDVGFEMSSVEFGEQ